MFNPIEYILVVIFGPVRSCQIEARIAKIYLKIILHIVLGLVFGLAVGAAVYKGGYEDVAPYAAASSFLVYVFFAAAIAFVRLRRLSGIWMAVAKRTWQNRSRF